MRACLCQSTQTHCVCVRARARALSRMCVPVLARHCFDLSFLSDQQWLSARVYFLCLCVCVCVCVHVCVHMYVYVCIFQCVYLSVPAGVQVHACACVRAGMCVCVCVCVWRGREKFNMLFCSRVSQGSCVHLHHINLNTWKKNHKRDR